MGQGQGPAIGTLLERTTRYVRLLYLLGGRKPPRSATPSPHRPLTCPNGCTRPSPGTQERELTLLEEIEAFTGFRIYPCNPPVQPLATTDTRDRKSVV